MTISNYVQIALLIVAVLCFWWAWTVPEGRGDEALGAGIAKLIGYGATALIGFMVAIWFVVSHIQFR